MTTTTAANPYSELGFGFRQNAEGSKNELDQAAFLRLMTEQLKNQDPLKPLGSQEFLGQMAQFSTVQGINSLNTTFNGVATALRDSQALGAVDLVGRDALIVSDKFSLGEEGGLQGEIGSPLAGKATIEISNAAGELVHREVIDAKHGYQAYSWDGTHMNGGRVPAGQYTIKASVTAGDKTETVVPIVKSRIDSVSFSSQGVVLNVQGLGTAPLSAVRRIG
jgi:flagellar basal-body rod modification protein FlgD